MGQRREAHFSQAQVDGPIVLLVWEDQYFLLELLSLSLAENLECFYVLP